MEECELISYVGCRRRFGVEDYHRWTAEHHADEEPSPSRRFHPDRDRRSRRFDGYRGSHCAGRLTARAVEFAEQQGRPVGDMALRIEKAFGVKMDTLMRMQSAYDIAQTRKRENTIKVRRVAFQAIAVRTVPRREPCESVSRQRQCRASQRAAKNAATEIVFGPRLRTSLVAPARRRRQ